MGDSDGDGNMFGWGGTPDIHAAVDFLKARPDVDPARIGGIGFSVGGEEMLQAAAENPDIAAVVSEGAGTRQTREQYEELGAAILGQRSGAGRQGRRARGVLQRAAAADVDGRGAADRPAPGAADLGAQRRQHGDDDAEVRRADRPVGRACGGSRTPSTCAACRHTRGSTSDGSSDSSTRPSAADRGGQDAPDDLAAARLRADAPLGRQDGDERETATVHVGRVGLPGSGPAGALVLDADDDPVRRHLEVHRDLATAVSHRVRDQLAHDELDVLDQGRRGVARALGPGVAAGQLGRVTTSYHRRGAGAGGHGCPWMWTRCVHRGPGRSTSQPRQVAA